VVGLRHGPGHTAH